jgi:cell division protein FtsB
MRNSVRRAIFLIVFALIGAYGLVELRSPQGIPALKQRWEDIRKLEEENANLQRENDYRRDRIKKLEGSVSEQELEIRKKLKLLRPGETSFILPEQPKHPSDRSADRSADQSPDQPADQSPDSKSPDLK